MWNMPMTLPMTLQPYRARAIRFLELWRESGWQVKIYGISPVNKPFEDRLRSVAKEIARKKLLHQQITATRYGVGCVTIHPAQMFNQIIVNWWERENELRHHVFKAYPETPFSFEDITVTGEAFCIWELRVIGFERQAWLDTVLVNPNGPDVEKYLACQLNELA